MTVVAPHGGDLPTRHTARVIDPARLGTVALVLVIVAPLAILIPRGLSRFLWLDDLYTIALMRAETLPALWHAITLGIDGNPPAFLTIAWLVTHASPGLDPVTGLRLLNAAIVITTLTMLFSVLRRFVTSTLAATSLATFLVANTGLVQAGMALRTYALYLLAFAAMLSCGLRLLERRTPRDALLLALVCVPATLAHTFGIVHVAILIAAAAFVAWRAGDRRTLVLALAAGVPALLVLAAWSPFVRTQLEVAKPYGWITAPVAFDLVKALAPSPVGFVTGSLTIAMLAVIGLGRWREIVEAVRRIEASGLFVALVGVGVAGFVLAAWAWSQVAFPLFVPRYLMPAVLLMLVPTTVAVVMLARVGPHALTAGTLLISALAAFAFATEDPILFGEIPCTDTATHTFLEDGVRDPRLALVATSPHAMVPRRTYRGGEVLFALDRDMVDRHPTRAPNNATDFHIMRRLSAIGLIDGVITTEELLARHREFMVLEEPTRAWLDHLRATRDVETTLLREGLGCRLWRVHVR